MYLLDFASVKIFDSKKLLEAGTVYKIYIDKTISWSRDHDLFVISMALEQKPMQANYLVLLQP